MSPLPQAHLPGHKCAGEAGSGLPPPPWHVTLWQQMSELEAPLNLSWDSGEPRFLPLGGASSPSGLSSECPRCPCPHGASLWGRRDTSEARKGPWPREPQSLCLGSQIWTQTHDRPYRKDVPALFAMSCGWNPEVCFLQNEAFGGTKKNHSVSPQPQPSRALPLSVSVALSTRQGHSGLTQAVRPQSCC